MSPSTVERGPWMLPSTTFHAQVEIGNNSAATFCALAHTAMLLADARAADMGMEPAVSAVAAGVTESQVAGAAKASERRLAHDRPELGQTMHQILKNAGHG